MGTTQPIKNKNDIKKLKQYFIVNGEIRNYAIVTLGFNTSIRIGDLLNLRWGDVYYFEANRYFEHMRIIEQKTNKLTIIPLNKEVIVALDMLKEREQHIEKQDYLFKGRTKINKPLSRTQVYRIIKCATKELNMEGNISCHSLRKTFGYHAWKQGTL